MLTWPRTIRGTDPPPRRSTPCSPHPPSPRPSSRDATPVGCSPRRVVLIAAMSVILGLDFLPAQPRLEVGRPAPTLVAGPAHRRSTSATILTQQQRDAARAAITPQYDFTLGRRRRGRDPAAARARHARSPRSRPRSPTGVKPERPRDAHPPDDAPGLSSRGDRTTLTGLDTERWTAVRAEAARVLETHRAGRAPRQRGRPDPRGRRGPDGGRPERRRARARPRRSSRPLIAPNSSFSADLTDPDEGPGRRGRRAGASRAGRSGETIVRSGDRVDDVAFEAIDLLRPQRGRPRRRAARSASSCCRCSSIGLLLTWTWRFRREFWHRNNVLLLLSLLLLFAVFALKLTAGRAWLPYALPLAAIGMLVTVLLDAGVAMVMTALIAVLAAAVNGTGPRARRLRAVRRDRRAS